MPLHYYYHCLNVVIYTFFRRNEYIRTVRLKSGKNYGTFKRQGRQSFNSKLENCFCKKNFYLTSNKTLTTSASRVFLAKHYVSHLKIGFLLEISRTSKNI